MISCVRRCLFLGSLSLLCFSLSLLSVVSTIRLSCCSPNLWNCSSWSYENKDGKKYPCADPSSFYRSPSLWSVWLLVVVVVVLFLNETLFSEWALQLHLEAFLSSVISLKGWFYCPFDCSILRNPFKSHAVNDMSMGSSASNFAFVRHAKVTNRSTWTASDFFGHWCGLVMTK